MPAQPALRPSAPPSTSVAFLAESISARLSGPDRDVTGIELRDQAIQPGDLFAALPGRHTHGAEYAAAAIERGAVAVLTDEAGVDVLGADPDVPVIVAANPRGVLGNISATIYGEPSERLKVIGVTGTSGKTTTSYLIEAGLTAAGLKPGLIGTIETRIDGHRVPSALTTPEAPQLQALLALMVEQGTDAVVMEVSSHALSLGRVDGTRFEVGAFTNLSQDHMDFHKDFDDYFAAKARLFAKDSTVRAEHAVVCIDDEWGVRMAGVAGDSAVTVSTTTTDADWTVENVEIAPGGSQSFDIDAPAGTIHATVRMPGRYNVANALLAVAACAAVGVEPAAAVPGIATVDVPGRVERVDRGQDFLAVVDYAHKPDALEKVITMLRESTVGRVAVVVGAGGDRDAEKRPIMGAVSARLADLLIVTDDNPRSEDPATIRSAIVAGATAEQGRAEIREIGDRADAIAQAVAWAKPGDVVLVAGKGHEVGQDIGGVKYPFDDREVLADALESRVGK